VAKKHDKSEYPTTRIDVEALGKEYIPVFTRTEPRGDVTFFESMNLHMRLPDGCGSDSTFYEDAWLVMMLRGIAWFMLKKKRERLAPVGSGGAIPSSCWDNQRPVWII
jgi:hypothetical protein